MRSANSGPWEGDFARGRQESYSVSGEARPFHVIVPFHAVVLLPNIRKRQCAARYSECDRQVGLALACRDEIRVINSNRPMPTPVIRIPYFLRLLLIAVALLGVAAKASPAGTSEKAVWKPVQFAIVRYNDDAPASWNMYHGEKKGTLLLRLWRRYLLVSVQEQEVYEIDPDKVKIQADNAEWSTSDIPNEPIETSEWKVRDVGPMRRIKFRFGKSGNFLDIQLPLLRNGQPAY
jgi:hypothetical protein